MEIIFIYLFIAWIAAVAIGAPLLLIAEDIWDFATWVRRKS